MSFQRSLQWICMVGVISLLLACGGIESLKHGKLTAMQDVLNEVEGDCLNDDDRSRAVNWAVMGIQDLTESRVYQERGSEEYNKTRNLIAHLALLASRRNQDASVLCHNISTAAKATNEYLALPVDQNIASVAK